MPNVPKKLHHRKAIILHHVAVLALSSSRNITAFYRNIMSSLVILEFGAFYIHQTYAIGISLC